VDTQTVHNVLREAEVLRRRQRRDGTAEARSATVYPPAVESAATPSRTPAPQPAATPRTATPQHATEAAPTSRLAVRSRPVAAPHVEQTPASPATTVDMPEAPAVVEETQPDDLVAALSQQLTDGLSGAALRQVQQAIGAIDEDDVLAILCQVVLTHVGASAHEIVAELQQWTPHVFAAPDGTLQDEGVRPLGFSEQFEDVANLLLNGLNEERAQAMENAIHGLASSATENFLPTLDEAVAKGRAGETPEQVIAFIEAATSAPSGSTS